VFVSQDQYVFLHNILLESLLTHQFMTEPNSIGDKLENHWKNPEKSLISQEYKVGFHSVHVMFIRGRWPVIVIDLPIRFWGSMNWAIG